MRLTPIRFILTAITALCGLQSVRVAAQPLPSDARPWQVVKHLVQVIGSPEKGIDRDRFRDRLTGEAAAINPDRLRGTWPAYVDVYIDTLITLEPSVVVIPADPTTPEASDRYDTTEHAVVYITTYVGGANDNYYFYCSRDSLWKVESWRQFPTTEERTELVDMMRGATDSENPGQFLNSIAAGRTLLQDKELIALFRDIHADAADVAPQLAASNSWELFPIQRIPFDSLDEYQALDGDLSPAERLFYRLNTSAMERLKAFGLRGISKPLPGTAAVSFDLASFLDHTIGYLYAQGPGDLPGISKDDFFMLKPMSERWWLYKRRGVVSYENAPVIDGKAAEVTRKNNLGGKASLLVPKQDTP